MNSLTDWLATAAGLMAGVLLGGWVVARLASRLKAADQRRADARRAAYYERLGR